MKRICGLFVLVLVLSACTPTPGPCDPCEVGTRVAAVETRIGGATRTATWTETRTPTRTATGTPTPSATPTPIVGGQLAIEVSPQVVGPGARYTLTLTWTGGAAEFGYWLGADTCCPMPEEFSWVVNGPAVKAVRPLVNSSAADGEKVMRAWLMVGGVRVEVDSAILYVTRGTPTATRTPMVGTPTPPTPTAQPVAVVEPWTWWTVGTTGGRAYMYLQIATSVGGRLWICDERFRLLDIQMGSRGWKRSEVGEVGSVWVYYEPPDCGALRAAWKYAYPTPVCREDRPLQVARVVFLDGGLP